VTDEEDDEENSRHDVLSLFLSTLNSLLSPLSSLLSPLSSLLSVIRSQSNYHS
jgi:hypothetical protein